MSVALILGTHRTAVLFEVEFVAVVWMKFDYKVTA
jgi:hypothetical protein